MIIINTINDGVTEFLPSEIDTPLFTNDIDLGVATKAELRNFFIYKAVKERLNYFQFNTPTAFGNPEYSRLDGFMTGLIAGYECDYDEYEDWFEVKTRNGRSILLIQKPKTSESYKESMKEINETISQIFR